LHDIREREGERTMTLEHGYYWSQIALTGIAFAAAVGAYVQLQTFKRFELLKILEAQAVRNARRILYHRVRQSKEPPADWWTDDTLEEAASSVCASFDIVGLIARHRNWRFFTREWAHPICWTYEALQEYIRMGNPDGYHGYHNLYKAAKKHQHSAPTRN
jgi:hypothetical protein